MRYSWSVIILNHVNRILLAVLYTCRKWYDHPQFTNYIRYFSRISLMILYHPEATWLATLACRAPLSGFITGLTLHISGVGGHYNTANPHKTQITGNFTSPYHFHQLFNHLIILHGARQWYWSALCNISKWLDIWNGHHEWRRFHGIWVLTCLPLDKMAATLAGDNCKCIFFNWNLFQLTIIQHWFRQWLGAKEAKSHYLNQCWPSSLMHISAALGVDELTH